MNLSTASSLVQEPESRQGENRLIRVGCPDHRQAGDPRLILASGNPPVGVHDRFDQQSKALELRKIKVLHSLIKTTINPVTIMFHIDGEILVQRLTPDAVREAVVVLEVSGLELQTHSFKPLKLGSDQKIKGRT